MDSGSRRVGRFSSFPNPDTERMDMDMSTSGHHGDSEAYTTPDYPVLPHPGFFDWEYTMRRTCQEIVPSLYLGLRNTYL